MPKTIPSKPTPKSAPSPKPNPNYPSKNPGVPSGPNRGNQPKPKGK